jgi:hypothetical protein
MKQTAQETRVWIHSRNRTAPVNQTLYSIPLGEHILRCDAVLDEQGQVTLAPEFV